MTARGLVAAPLLGAALLAGCGAPTPPPPPAAARPAPTPAAPPAPPPAVVPSAPAVEAVLPAEPPPTYEVRGRRDPFETLEVREGSSSPLVASARLTGIVRGAQGPLALIEMPDGLGYVLRPGDTLGDGRLVEIGADSVVFRVAPRPGSAASRVVLRLPGD